MLFRKRRFVPDVFNSKTELKSRLTPEQLADFERNQAFNVRGSDGRLYRIAVNKTAGVYGFEPCADYYGRVPGPLPVTFFGYFVSFPEPDLESDDEGYLYPDEYTQALAKKVWLEANARDLRQRACRSGVSDPAPHVSRDYGGKI